ncbi:MAG TPA: DUF692 domain-containing protein [Gammaproteobacteria bacterium]|nr:DUF692 domain-containing protein [Gammaproteobacteria bacterium]
MTIADSKMSGPKPIPAQAGIGLRGPHIQHVLDVRPDVAWFEVHSENYFAPGGRAVAELDAIRRDYPLSLHGVGVSLGGCDPLDDGHIENLRRAIARFVPALVSEHLCWTAAGTQHLHDLLPLPYTEEALRHVSGRIVEVQQRLGRRLLIENVSSYLEFEHSTIPEWEFLLEVAIRSGCGILLDVNNIYVSAINHGFDARRFIDAMPAEAVGEIHLAGHVRKDIDGTALLIDSHNRPVTDAVWELYAHALESLGPKPTLIEWDSELPEFAMLQAEAAKAGSYLEARHADAA